MKTAYVLTALTAMLVGHTAAAPLEAKPLDAKDLKRLAERRELQSKRQNVDWEFTFYQNTRCSGQADKKSGLGTTACQTGILNGSALGFIKGFIDPDCAILFFSDAVCTVANVNGGLQPGDATTCMTVLVPGTNVQSWAATCP